MAALRCGHCVDCCDPAPPVRFVEPQQQPQPTFVCQPTTGSGSSSASSTADEWHFDEREQRHHHQSSKYQRQSSAHSSNSNSNSKINHMILNGTQPHLGRHQRHAHAHAHAHAPGGYPATQNCSRRHFAQDSNENQHHGTCHQIQRGSNAAVHYSSTSTSTGRAGGAGAGANSEEYRSLHGSQNIMPSSIRQRRGMSCLSLLQLPKKCTNVDPRRHKAIRPLSLDKIDSIYSSSSSSRKDFVLGRERREEEGEDCHLRTSGGGKRLRVDSNKPFMTGSKVGISYFLNPELSVRSSSGSDPVDYHRRLWEEPTTTSRSQQPYLSSRGDDNNHYHNNNNNNNNRGFRAPPTYSTGRGRFYAEQQSSRLVDWRTGGAGAGSASASIRATGTNRIISKASSRRMGRTLLGTSHSFSRGKGERERIRSFSVSPPSVLCTHPKAPSLWSPNPLQDHQPEFILEGTTHSSVAWQQNYHDPKPSGSYWNPPYPARGAQQQLL